MRLADAVGVPLSIARAFGPPPSHLDPLLSGEMISMAGAFGMAHLFGVDRKRLAVFVRDPSFSKKVGTKRLYGYRAFLKIADGLLRENSRRPWLKDPAVRLNVLRGIQRQVDAVAPAERIQRAFTTFLNRHLRSGK